LAVSPAFSGRGYGTSLIRAGEEKAQELHYPKIALNVDQQNARAYRLYQYLGYRTDKERTLYGEAFFHMVKYLHAPTGASQLAHEKHSMPGSLSSSQTSW